MAKKTNKQQGYGYINSISSKLLKQNGAVKVEDFRNLDIKIPANITAEVSEDKNGFLFDSNTGRVYALNRTASFIFSKIKAGMVLSEVVKQLTARYDVDERVAMSDMQDFFYQLREFNVGEEE